MDCASSLWTEEVLPKIKGKNKSKINRAVKLTSRQWMLRGNGLLLWRETAWCSFLLFSRLPTCDYVTNQIGFIGSKSLTVHSDFARIRGLSHAYQKGTSMHGPSTPLHVHQMVPNFSRKDLNLVGRVLVIKHSDVTILWGSLTAYI